MYHRPIQPRHWWPQPPPLPARGGSHSRGPRPSTRRTRRGVSMMRPGPRLTRAADAKATIGAGNRALDDRPACHPNLDPRSSTGAPGEPEGAADDIGANDGTAIQLRYLATSLDHLNARDVATEPDALAIWAWAEGGRRNSRCDLQRVGGTALMYTDHNAPSALAKHLTMLAAQGRHPPRSGVSYPVLECVRPWALSARWLPHSTEPHAKRPIEHTHIRHQRGFGQTHTHTADPGSRHFTPVWHGNCRTGLSGKCPVLARQ